MEDARPKIDMKSKTLDIHELPKIQEICEQIIREAGELLREGFRSDIRIETKSNANDWVTQYDKQCELLLVERLTAAFPTHGIVGEEGSNLRPESDLQWYIDPIDGTTNFAHGLAPFCISMALYQQTTPLIGMIYEPIGEELFFARNGAGAYVTNRLVTNKRLQVSSETNLGRSLLITGFPYDRRDATNNNYREITLMLDHAQGVRRIGSAALDLCYVAAGRAEAYWEQFLNSWDIAAGILIAAEAGATLSMLDGSPMFIQERVSLLAANPTIHSQVLAHFQTLS